MTPTRHALRATITALTTGALILTSASIANAANDEHATLNLTATQATAYPHKDGYKDTLKFYLAATTNDGYSDEDYTYGDTINGNLTITEGTQTITTPFSITADNEDNYDNTDDDGNYLPNISVDITSLPAGSATATATYTTNDGSVIQSNTVNVQLKQTAITNITTHRNITTIYPTKDGYRDTASIKIIATTTTGASLPITGQAKLTRGGHTIKTWKLTKSTQTITWNGKVNGKIKPGTYTLTATEKAAEGTTHTAKTTLTVKNGHLATRTTTYHYTAHKVLGSKYYNYSTGNYGDCWYDTYTYNDQVYGHRTPGAIFCEGYDSYGYGDYDNDYSIICKGHVNIPAAVRTSTKYAKPLVTVSQHTKIFSNDAYMYIHAGGSGKEKEVYNGNNTASFHYKGNPSKLGIDFELGIYGWAGVKDYTVTYQYKALVK